MQFPLLLPALLILSGFSVSDMTDTSKNSFYECHFNQDVPFNLNANFSFFFFIIERALMPYISEDLVYCCSFLLRCTLHLDREDSSAATTATDVLQLYKTNLNKFFIKRDSPLPIGLFVRAFGYHWPDAGQLVEPLIDYAFSSSILKNRKYLAISLLKNLVRNSAALASLDRPVLIKQIETLLNNSQRVGNQEEKYKEYIQKSIPLQTTHSSSFPFLYSIFKDFLFSSFFL